MNVVYMVEEIYISTLESKKLHVVLNGRLRMHGHTSTISSRDRIGTGTNFRRAGLSVDWPVARLIYLLYYFYYTNLFESFYRFQEYSVEDM